MIIFVLQSHGHFADEECIKSVQEEFKEATKNEVLILTSRLHALDLVLRKDEPPDLAPSVAKPPATQVPESSAQAAKPAPTVDEEDANSKDKDGDDANDKDGRDDAEDKEAAPDAADKDAGAADAAVAQAPQVLIDV